MFFVMAFSIMFALLVAIFLYDMRVFGRLWLSETNMSPERWERIKSEVAIRIVVFVFSLFMFIGGFYMISDTMSAAGFIDNAKLAILIFASFVAPILLFDFLWGVRNSKILLVNALYWFVVLLGAAVFVSFI